MDWVNSLSWNKINTVSPNAGTQIKYTSNFTDSILTAVYNNLNYSTIWTVSSGLGIVFGLSFKVSESFIVSAEIEPTISYRYSKTTTSSMNYSTTTTESDSIVAYLYNNNTQKCPV